MNTSNLEPGTKNLEPHSHISKGNLMKAILHTLCSLYSPAIPCHFREVYAGWKHGSRQLAKIGLASLGVIGAMAGNPERADADLVLMTPDTNTLVSAPLYGAALGTPTAEPSTVVVGSGTTPDFFFDQNLTLLGGQGNVVDVIDTATGLQPNRTYQLTDSGFMYERDLDAQGNVQNWNLGSGAIAIGAPQSIGGHNIIPYLVSSDGGQNASLFGLNLTDNSITNLNLSLSAYKPDFNESTITGLDSYLDPQGNLRLGIVDKNNFDNRAYIRDINLAGNVGFEGYFSGHGTGQDLAFDVANNKLYSVTDTGRILAFDYKGIPEPGTAALVILFGSALARYARQRNYTPIQPGSEK